jgi:hypothetical protein
MVGTWLLAAADPHARLFAGPKGGRICTAVLRDATHWDEFVAALGREHLVRHDLRIRLTWMADADSGACVAEDPGHGVAHDDPAVPAPGPPALDETGEAFGSELCASLFGQPGCRIR